MPATARPMDTGTFLAWENRRRRRYELVGGAVRAMAGGTRAHDLVRGNALVAFAARAATSMGAT